MDDVSEIRIGKELTGIAGLTSALAGAVARCKGAALGDGTGLQDVGCRPVTVPGDQFAQSTQVAAGRLFYGCGGRGHWARWLYFQFIDVGAE